VFRAGIVRAVEAGNDPGWENLTPTGAGFAGIMICVSRQDDYDGKQSLFFWKIAVSRSIGGRIDRRRIYATRYPAERVHMFFFNPHHYH
jgi:hypothetical protein